MRMDVRKAAGEAARASSFPESNVLAVVHVESDGESFAQVDGRDTPLMRFEGHIFWRRLSGEERKEAVAAGLAKQGVGSVKNPASQQARWDKLIKRAMLINRQAALESCSVGIGQVMIFHWKDLGFASPEAMFEHAFTLTGQIDLMLRFVKANGLDDELIAGAWAPFARGYNGAGYRKNRYDERLAEAAALYGAADAPANGMLRMGSKGKRVRELQALLVRAGHSVTVDGDYGIATRDQLKLFQKAQGLTADGIYGPQTERALAGFRQAREDIPGKQKLIDVPGVKKGALAAVVAVATPEAISTAKAGLETAAAQIGAAGIQSALLDQAVGYLTAGAGVLGVVGVGVGVVLAVRGWLKSERTVEA